MVPFLCHFSFCHIEAFNLEEDADLALRTIFRYISLLEDYLA